MKRMYECIEFYGDMDSMNPNILGNVRRRTAIVDVIVEQIPVMPYAGTEGYADIPTRVVVPTGERADLIA